MTTAIDKVNGAVAPAEPRFDPKALAEAEAIRKRAEADAEARRIAAQAEAEAARIKAEAEAEKQRLANKKEQMRQERAEADHKAYLAKKAAETAAAEKAKEEVEKTAAEKATEEADRLAEQERTEQIWKWGARSIYAVGLIIAAPVQFMHFWDPERKFLVAAPALLEGFAIVLACGAAWAVAHRRDVAPYRIGIMISAVIAAVVNLYGGLTDPAIGFNAGLIGAIASLGGPIVLMAYEHGIAQQADGIPSRRERRDADRASKKAAAEKTKAKADKEAAETRALVERADAQHRAKEEQARRDADRREHHPEVWAVAEAMRSARGSAVVTEQIWADAWYRVTGSKTVGITPEIEAKSRAAQARMRTVTETPIMGEFSLIESQKGARAKRDLDTPDKRRFNGGTPPRRTAGDTAPYSPLAKRQAAVEQKPNATQKPPAVAAD